MAEFSTNRLSDTSAISTVDDALAAAERDHASILGVTTDQSISGSIFGGVDSSSRITGDGGAVTPAAVPKIYNTESTESVSAAIDFSNVEGGNDIGWRIVPIQGELRLYEREPHDENSGTLVRTLSSPDLFTNLGDTDLSAPLSDYNDKLIGIVSGVLTAVEPGFWRRRVHNLHRLGRYADQLGGGRGWDGPCCGRNWRHSAFGIRRAGFRWSELLRGSL